MAKVTGGTVLLSIDRLGGTDYDTVVCLTSVSKDDSVGEVDASSACGPDVSPGALSISRGFEGQLFQNPATGEISGTDLRMLMYAKTLVGYRIGPVTPVTGDEVEVGTGRLFALSSTYAHDSNGVFSGTLKPSGTPTITITV